MRLWTGGDWRVECVSDAVRVVVGKGRQKLLLARCATKQISEKEVHANALVMAQSKRLYAFVQRMFDETNCICKLNEIAGTNVWCTKCEAQTLLSAARSGAEADTPPR